VISVWTQDPSDVGAGTVAADEDVPCGGCAVGEGGDDFGVVWMLDSREVLGPLSRDNRQPSCSFSFP
jgi:hypothetical protein